MKFFSVIIFTIALTIHNNLIAQSKNQNNYIRIIGKFEQWKSAQLKSGKYASYKNCNRDTVTQDNYKGPLMGLPKDIDISFTDLNGDQVTDALIIFHPTQCDGGNASMNTQARVLIVSNGSSYRVDDSYIDKMESRYAKGWFGIEKAAGGTIFGNYYEYKDEDGKCCPGIKRPFTIDYKTKKLDFNDGK